jgi:hypothetical protein
VLTTGSAAYIVAMSAMSWRKASFMLPAAHASAMLMLDISVLSAGFVL